MSIPENTGGTYKSNLSYMHYRAGNGKVYNFFPDQELSDSAGGVNFNRDGFDNIYTMPTKNDVKYLLYGTVQGCSTYRGEYIQLVHFERGKAIIDFSLTAGEREDYSGDEGD